VRVPFVSLWDVVGGGGVTFPEVENATMAKKVAPAASAGGRIRVQATAVGFYDDIRWRPGDIFDLHPRTGTFTKLVIDEATGKPALNEEGLMKSRLTEEPDEDEPITLTAEQQFSKKWMRKVPMNTPKRAKPANQVIAEKHDEVLAARMSGQAVPGPETDPPSGDENVLGD